MRLPLSQDQVLRLIGSIDQHLIAGVLATQEVAVVMHLGVDRQLGHGQAAEATNIGIVSRLHDAGVRGARRS